MAKGWKETRHIKKNIYVQSVLTCATPRGTWPLHFYSKHASYFNGSSPCYWQNWKYSLIRSHCCVTTVFSHRLYTSVFKLYITPVHPFSQQREDVLILKSLLHISTTLPLHLGPQSRVKNCRILLPKHSCYITLRKRKETKKRTVHWSKRVNKYLTEYINGGSCMTPVINITVKVNHLRETLI